jgi:hypothetical protein
MVFIMIKVFSAAFLLSLSTAACAHTETPKEGPVQAPTSETPVAAPVTTKVSLPYMFSRRGVEIRVNSVELVHGRLEVSLILQEVRQQPAELLASTLMQARTPAGVALSFVGYGGMDSVMTDRTIAIRPGEKRPLSLFFQLPEASAGPGSAIELQFPTGKWWSSKQPAGR